MKIKILPKIILSKIKEEDELLDLSTIESIYEIRKLRLAIYYGSEQEIEIKEKNVQDYVFIEDFKIWISPEEYVEII